MKCRPLKGPAGGFHDSITKPTGSSPRYTARYQGFASGFFAARIEVKGWDPAAVGEHGKEPEPYEFSERGR